MTWGWMIRSETSSKRCFTILSLSSMERFSLRWRIYNFFTGFPFNKMGSIAPKGGSQADDKGGEAIATAVMAQSKINGLEAKAQDAGRGHQVPILQPKAVLVGLESGKIMVRSIMAIGGKRPFLGIKIICGALAIKAIIGIEAKIVGQPQGDLQTGCMGADAPIVPIVPVIGPQHHQITQVVVQPSPYGDFQAAV